MSERSEVKNFPSHILAKLRQGIHPISAIFRIEQSHELTLEHLPQYIADVRDFDAGSLYVSTLPSHVVSTARWKRQGTVHLTVADYGIPTLVMAQNMRVLESDPVLRKDWFIENLHTQLLTQDANTEKKPKWYGGNPKAQIRLLKKGLLVINHQGTWRFYPLPVEREVRLLLFNAKLQQLEEEIAQQKRSQKVPGWKKQEMGKRGRVGVTPTRPDAEGGI